MRLPAGWAIIPAMLFAPIPTIAAGSAPDQIGSWVIACPGESQPCLMRGSKRFLDKAGVTGDLEVQAQGNALVPVIALRGLPSEMLMAAALAGKAEASIQFAGGIRQDLACAPSSAGYICSPSEAAGEKLAAALPAAREVTVRVALTVTGVNPLPTQERSLTLSGTTEALARLRTVGPTHVPTAMTELTSQSPAGLMAVADKMLKAAGYPNGVADVRGLLAKYMKK